jgi:hypothetical protein
MMYSLREPEYINWFETCDNVARPGVRNLYGCTVCPRCGDGHRTGRNRKYAPNGIVIECDQCGLIQAVARVVWCAKSSSQPVVMATIAAIR